MGTDPRVSAILATYHRGEYVEGAIETVLNQTYDSIEVVVVNDDPDDDETVEVLERYDDDPRVVVEHSDVKRGVSASRNRAAELASGEFLCILDDDDRWYPSKVEAQLDLFERRSSEYAVVYTGGEVRKDSPNGAVINRASPDDARTGDIWPDVLRDWNMAPHSGHMIRTEAFWDVGGFDESLDHGEDWDLSIRLAREYKFDAVDDCLTIRIYHDDNVSKLAGHYAQRQNVLLKYGDEILADDDIRRGFFSEWHKMEAYDAIQRGRRTDAMRRYALSFVYRPDVSCIPLLFLAAGGPGVFKGVEWLLRKLRR